MQKPRSLPQPERLSILAATILLAYALARYINLPVRDFELQLPGLFLSFPLNLQMMIPIVVAGMTAAGADWLLRDHPALAGKKVTLVHWLLPGLTALVIGLPLVQMEPGYGWWIGLILGGVLLTLVLVTEYIVVDPKDIRQPPAAAFLTAVSYALVLILAVTLKSTDQRLIFILPLIFLAVFLVSLRTLHLRLEQYWAFIESGVISLIVVQWSAALHYIPLTPIAYGLILLAPAYALTSLVANLSEEQPLRRAAVEPLVISSIVWGVAFFLR